MNSCDIAERQNEQSMLKVQYAAGHFYNLAEQLNYFIWLFCFVSAFSIFLPDGLPLYLSILVPFAADIIAWVLMVLVNTSVKKAADLRKYFDACSIDIRADQYIEADRRRLAEIVEKCHSKNLEDAKIQMGNTGKDNPPGVRDWYTFSKQYDGLEAKFECQRQNIWWDKKLSQIRCALVLSVFTIVVVVFIILAVRNDLVKILLCSAGLLIKLAERVFDNGKYLFISIKIEGAKQMLEVHLTIEGVEQFQALIDERRAINILGINYIHKILANKLTNKYENISNP